MNELQKTICCVGFCLDISIVRDETPNLRLGVLQCAARSGYSTLSGAVTDEYGRVVAVSYLRWLANGFSSQKPGFTFWVIHVRFLVEKTSL
jgi:hypothetical protein